MFIQRKKIAGISFIALLCALEFTTSSQSFGAVKKKKATKIPADCIACLNSFSPEKLKFTKQFGKKSCEKRLASCDKVNRTDQCESIILDCFDANCSEAGSCADEKANRALFVGCLQAENRFLPYQCASYIKGFAKSKAEEAAQAIEDAEAQREAELAKAQAEADAKVKAEEAKAEQAKAQAAAKAAEEETKRKQIEEQNKLAMQQQQAELERKAKEEDAARKKREIEEERNNRPSVKYQNLLSTLKKDLSTAKGYTNKLFGLLGITTTKDEQKNGNSMFFPPQIVVVSSSADENQIKTISSDNEDNKSKALRNGSRYKEETSFVCTKDTKESVVKAEFTNIYNTLKSAYDKISTGVSEIEATMAEGETAYAIDDEKLDSLYSAQNQTYELMQDVNTRLGKMITTCETRCKGINNMGSFSTTSTGLQFDKDGNIIQEDASKTKDTTYNCKDFEKLTADTTASNANNFMALMGGGITKSDMFGGQSKLAIDLTRRLSTDILHVDRDIDELQITLQSGKSSGSGSSSYQKSTTCAQYSFGNDEQYLECLSGVLGGQMSVLTQKQTNTTLMAEMDNTIGTIINLLESVTFKNKRGNETINCYLNTDGSTANKPNNNTPVLNKKFDNYSACVRSLNGIVNKVRPNSTNDGYGNDSKTIREASVNGTPEKDGYSSSGIIITNDGNSYSPKEFATKILEWSGSASPSPECQIKIVRYQRGVESITYDSHNNQQKELIEDKFYTGEINQYESKLKCGTCEKAFFSINKGQADKCNWGGNESRTNKSSTQSNTRQYAQTVQRFLKSNNFPTEKL